VRSLDHGYAEEANDLIDAFREVGLVRAGK